MDYKVKVYDEKSYGSELIVVKEFEDIKQAREYAREITLNFDWAVLTTSYDEQEEFYMDGRFAQQAQIFYYILINAYSRIILRQGQFCIVVYLKNFVYHRNTNLIKEVLSYGGKQLRSRLSQVQKSQLL